MIEIECICPLTSTGKPRHEYDKIELKPVLDFRSALTVRNAIGLLYQDDPEATAAEVLAAMSETYILVGIKSWTLVDDKNKPVPVSHLAIRERLLPNWDAASAVAEQADDLYSDKVILPLLNRGSTSSPPTPIAASTSAVTGSASMPRKRSKQSSISTIRTEGIERMSASPGGDYS